MKIALLGYGKMGREVEKIALLRNHEVPVKIDSEDDWKEKGDKIEDCDVAVDFSYPQVVTENIKRCFKHNLPVVVGTTGWDGEKKEVTRLCREKDQSMFYASNFSIGVNIYFEINKKLAGLMNEYAHYEPLIEEIHHLEKIDAPSGTAINLANDIISRLKKKASWVNRPSKSSDELEIISLRQERTPGTHIVQYESEYDILEIKHIAKSRTGFAIGAVMAAEWLPGRKGVFEMKDMLGFPV